MNRILVLQLVLAFSASATPGQAAEPDAVTIGGEWQSFLTDRLVASATGLTRVWHQPEKHGTPVLAKRNDWEGLGPYLYGTVVRDSESGQFKMWYNCYVGGRPDYFVCYATSQDGLQWSRPACNVVHDPRLPPDNNVVMLGSGLPDYRQCLSPSVLIRPHEPDPARRYAMLYWDVSAQGVAKFFGLCLAFSPDGIRWTNHSANPIFDGVSDVTDAQFDSRSGRYLLHYKIWRVDGDVVASNLPRGQARNVSYWPTWEMSKLEGDRVRFQGRMIDYTADDSSPMSGTVDFARIPKSRRVVARAESKDLVVWSQARLVFELPEASDPADTSTYGMSTFSYGGRFLGLLRVFHNDREIDLELASSDDDKSWTRTNPGKPFIPLGPAGDFDAGMVFSANAPVVVRDELWFYYGAFTKDHASSDSSQACAIGLAKLRQDGFASYQAKEETGELITVPLQINRGQLRINAVAKPGRLDVEIRSLKGEPIPGFTFAECQPFVGDAVSQVVAWRGQPDLSQLAGQPIRIIFRLKRANLFAFQVR